MKSLVNGLLKITLTALLPWVDLYGKDASRSTAKNKELNEYEIRSIIRAHKSHRSLTPAKME